MTHFLYHSSLLYGSNEEPPKKPHLSEIPDYHNRWGIFKSLLEKYFIDLAKWIENAGVFEEPAIMHFILFTRLEVSGYFGKPNQILYKDWQPLEDHSYTLDVKCEIQHQYWYHTRWVNCEPEVYNRFSTGNDLSQVRKVCRLKEQMSKFEKAIKETADGSIPEGKISGYIYLDELSTTTPVSDEIDRLKVKYRIHQDSDAWNRDDATLMWAHLCCCSEEFIEELKHKIYHGKDNYKFDEHLQKYYGYRTQAECNAYDTGRAHGENVTEQFVNNWDGNRNSVFGCMLWEKYAELKAKGLI